MRRCETSKDLACCGTSRGRSLQTLKGWHLRRNGQREARIRHVGSVTGKGIGTSASSLAADFPALTAKRRLPQPPPPRYPTLLFYLTEPLSAPGYSGLATVAPGGKVKMRKLHRWGALRSGRRVTPALRRSEPAERGNDWSNTGPVLSTWVACRRSSVGVSCWAKVACISPMAARRRSLVCCGERPSGRPVLAS